MYRFSKQVLYFANEEKEFFFSDERTSNTKYVILFHSVSDDSLHIFYTDASQQFWTNYRTGCLPHLKILSRKKRDIPEILNW